MKGNKGKRPPKQFICMVCGNKFIKNTYYAKYCDDCCEEARKKVSREYHLLRYDKVKKVKQEQKRQYTCIRCERKILIHGTATNRKICNECISKDSHLKYNIRKDVIEEVLPCE